MLTIQEIYKRLPHRYPFLMVDKILSVEEGKTVVGLKNITVNEPYFQGHFPDEPIMPGVMIIETMAQIGGFVFDIVNERGYVIGVDKTKFKKVVIPGDTLIVEATLIQRFGSMGKVKAVAKVDNVEVASGEITYNFKPNNG